MAQSKLQLRLDPWPPEYDGPIQFEQLEEETAATIDTDVEATDWTPIQAEAASLDKKLYFIDGSRRIEARVLADHPQGLAHGLFATVAVGAVSAGESAAECQSLKVERWLILGSGLIPEDMETTVGNQKFIFTATSTAGSSPRDLLNTLQNLMREREAELASSLQSAGRVFADGPLTYFTEVTTPVVGIIKTLHKMYLSGEHFRTVLRLNIGERSPVFAITDGKYDRYSWFLRVSDRRVYDHDLAGILRLEVRSGMGVERAVEVANSSQSTLPRFASSPVRDPRAPQNLLPIGALEERLRHRMGDPWLIRRAIESAILKGVVA